MVSPSLVGAGGSLATSSETSGVDVAGWRLVFESESCFATISFPVDMMPETPGSRLRLPVLLAPEIGVFSLALPVLLVDVLRVY